jgi:hypothetical protein
MTDIETMGMSPDGAIVGIAAAMFDMEKQEIGPTFKRAVNLATSVGVGMTLKPSTIMFWMGQPEEARRSIMWNTVSIQSALTDFNEWMAEHSRPRDLRVYGNSPSFDLVILQSAYRLTGIACPWHYTNERDFRTIRAMYPSVEYDTDEKGKEAHDPLVDVEFQIRHLFKIKNRARKPN